MNLTVSIKGNGMYIAGVLQADTKCHIVTDRAYT